MSNFVVSARKYRPTRFDEVVGQQHVSSTLKKALSTDHLAHAFLFCGPRGVGKTTCARILAKAVNCENASEQEFEPCGHCSSCKSFDENASFNIIELDAASNNSVENMRTLTEQVRFQPQHGSYKVFIIDEVHMLSTQAFNAFLKTLEEPPPYAKFILATTEKHKIIPTILSRCQIFDFKRISNADMVTHLQSIAQKENIKADEEALLLIAQKSDGALRDALSVFDRIAAQVEGHIRFEDVVECLNLLDYDFYFKMVDYFMLEDVSSVLLTFDEIVKRGFDAELFLLGLGEHLREILVCKDPKTIQLLQVGEKLKARYQQQANLISTSFVLTALSMINQSEITYEKAKNKRLHVEMMLSKMTVVNRIIEQPSIPRSEKKNTIAKSESAASPSNIPPKETTHAKATIPVDPTPKPSAPSQEIENTESASKPIGALLQPPQIDSSPTEPPPIAEVEKVVSEPVSAANNDIKKQKATPDVKLPMLGSLESITAAIEKEERTKASQIQAFSIENMQTQWNNYAAEVPSPSLRLDLEQATLNIEGVTLLITTGSTVSKDRILQETKLIENIRTHFAKPEMIIDIQLDPTRVKEEVVKKPKKFLSNKEKFEIMVEQNPLFGEMKNRFQLRIDHDS